MKDETSMSNYSLLPSNELQNECSHQGHIMALYLKAQGEYLLVGDLVRSVSLLKYRVAENTLEEVARDFNSNYMRAIEIVTSPSTTIATTEEGENDYFFLGSDDHANLFALRRLSSSSSSSQSHRPATGTTSSTANANTASEEEQMKLEVRGEYHVGDYINVFARGTLVIAPIDALDAVGAKETTTNSSISTADPVINTATSTPIASAAALDIFDHNYRSVTGYPISEQGAVMFGTISGALGTLLTLSETSYRFFQAVEKSMKTIVSPIGGLPHDDWRCFQNEMRTATQRNIIDGDLVEMFLDLNKDQLEVVSKEIVEELQLSMLKSSSSSTANAGAAGNEAEGLNAKTSMNSGSGSHSIGNLLPNSASNRLAMTVEEIYRRVEDIARLH